MSTHSIALTCQISRNSVWSAINCLVVFLNILLPCPQNTHQSNLKVRLFEPCRKSHKNGESPKTAQRFQIRSPPCLGARSATTASSSKTPRAHWSATIPIATRAGATIVALCAWASAKGIMTGSDAARCVGRRVEKTPNFYVINGTNLMAIMGGWWWYMNNPMEHVLLITNIK